jgi:hypothetical protein
MKHLTYITEINGEAYELIPDWDKVAILNRYNGIRKFKDCTFELHPEKAFMFDNIDTCEEFIANFGKIKHRYDEILPKDTVYYVIHDLTNLKKQHNYVDRLISKNEQV